MSLAKFFRHSLLLITRQTVQLVCLGCKINNVNHNSYVTINKLESMYATINIIVNNKLQYTILLIVHECT